jgi:hypothetical protein
MINRRAEKRPPSTIRRPQQKKIILILLLIFLSIPLPIQVFADNNEQKKENLVSNEEFLRGSVRNLLHKAFLDFPKGKTGFIFVNSEDSANWLLEDELTSYLQSLNFQVTLHPANGQSEAPEAWSLFYRIIKMELSYPQVKRKGFLGPKLVTRKAKLNLSFRLEEKRSGGILWTKRETEEQSDVVKKEAIKYLNNNSYSFLSPPLPEDSKAKYVEPALVAAVVGGLVYLFFANR